jgi:hypothetical protein
MPAHPIDSPTAAQLDAWLADLGVDPVERLEREEATSWDLRLDGRRRFDIRFTIMFEPRTGAVIWVHYAPPIGDSQRRSYRKLLRWNDQFPFAKFALAEDERPLLTTDIPIRSLDARELGVALARMLSICDELLEESAGWLWIGGRIPVQPPDRMSRGLDLLTRFAGALGDLAEAAHEDEPLS